MQEALAVASSKRRRLPLSLTVIHAAVPSFRETGLVLSSAILSILSFPNFDLWWLAWIAIAPLILAVATTSKIRAAFMLGMLWGIVFFYGSCWWLAFPMIHYGHVPTRLAYALVLLPVLIGSTFPAVVCALTSLSVSRFGKLAILLVPLFWVSLDLLRYAITGEVWNAIGYSQAFHPLLIQSARVGGVYLVTCLVVAVNAAFALLVLQPNRRSLVVSALIFMTVISIVFVFRPKFIGTPMIDPSKETLIVAVQPNVPMTQIDEVGYRQLLAQHLQLSKVALSNEPQPPPQHRLVIWPESPMNFSYSSDPQLENVIASFTKPNHSSVLLNSLEQSENGSSYNSAILVNEDGQKVARYDKIRLMPFGEYVPLPRWLPGSGSVRGIVGEFTPGSSYTLMPLGAIRAGVFICVEAIHPGIARTFTNNGADLLINISNDGYLGPTAVMRGHLANAVFRAVENNRDLIRVTNSGISAYITADGSVRDETAGFQQDVRTWTVAKRVSGTTFYTHHGDLFAYLCVLITLGIVSAIFMTQRKYRGN